MPWLFYNPTMKRTLACILLSVFSMSLAEDWPQFRGPGGQGHSASKNVPLNWSAESNVAWKVEIPGGGWASPVLVGQRIYLNSAVPIDEDTHALTTLCLDATDGSTIWSTALFERPIIRIHKKNSHASVTPLIVDERIYVHFGAQGTACLDLDGKVLWTQEDISYKMVHGNGGCTVVADGKLIFSCDGGDQRFMIALDVRTGKVAWKTERDIPVKKSFSFASPLVLGNQVISPGSGGVVAYDVRDGSKIWQARYGEGYSVIPRPVIGHNMVFVGSGYDKATALGIELGGKGDVTDTHVKWIKTRGAPHTPSMILYDDMLFMVSDIGVASCVNPLTGDVYWQERVGGQQSASPVLAEGRIYFQDERGKASVIKAAKTFELLATNELKERTLSSYAVSEGAIFIRTEKHLYRIGASEAP